MTHKFILELTDDCKGYNEEVERLEREYGIGPIDEHDAKVRADVIDELLNNVSESIIWDVLAEIMKRNIGASDGADKVIDYLQEVAEKLKEKKE